LGNAITRITRQSYRQAAQVLARAFVDEPVSVASYKGFSSERRVRALEVDFSNEILSCIRRGYPIQVNMSDKIVAAAVIFPPGSYPLPLAEQYLLLFKSLIGIGIYDFRDYFKWLTTVSRYHPREAHYYLYYLGVEPEHQGKGYGTMILKHLTALADASGVGCYLENSNPRNVPLYTRAGFTCVKEMEIVGIRSWLMWRPAVVTQL
jgi:GNAT superfamily N-acetyltransferase